MQRKYTYTQNSKNNVARFWYFFSVSIGIEGINVNAYPKSTTCLFAISKLQRYTMTVITSSHSDLPFSLPYVCWCIAIHQYVALHQVHCIDTVKHNIVAAL